MPLKFLRRRIPDAVAVLAEGDPTAPRDDLRDKLFFTPGPEEEKTEEPEVVTPEPEPEPEPDIDRVLAKIEALRAELLTSFDDIDSFAREKSRRLKAKFANLPEDTRQGWRQTIIRMVELDLLSEFATRAGPDATAKLEDAPEMMLTLIEARAE